MADLYIFNDKIESIFQLLGQKENNVSYSVGYAFSNCRHFFQFFFKHIKIKSPFDPDKIKIRLQTQEKEKGFTDFEIIQDNEFHIVGEAKRGWTFPSKEQLDKYATKPTFVSSMAKELLFLTKVFPPLPRHILALRQSGQHQYPLIQGILPPEKFIILRP